MHTQYGSVASSNKQLWRAIMYGHFDFQWPPWDKMSGAYGCAHNRVACVFDCVWKGGGVLVMPESCLLACITHTVNSSTHLPAVCLLP